MDFNELEKDYNKDNKRKLLFLLRKNSKDGISYKEIQKEIPNKPCNTWKLLNKLEMNSLLDIEIRNSGRDDVRNIYRLNENGIELTEKIIYHGLIKQEIKLLDLLCSLNNCRYQQVIKDFWDFILIFQKYSITEYHSEFFELIHNIILQMKKYDKYEEAYAQLLNNTENVVQKIDKPVEH